MVTRDSTKYLSDFISLPVAMFCRETLAIIIGIKASRCNNLSEVMCESVRRVMT